MTIETLQSFLGWSTLINSALLTAWFLFFLCGRGFIYRFHGKIFKISEESFDAIHYAGMAVYKVGIFLLNLVPYLALHLMQQ